MNNKTDANDNRDFSSTELATDELSQITGGSYPTETVSLTFGKIEWVY